MGFLPRVLTRELADAVEEVLQNQGYEAYLHAAYSGRGMYGDTCIGFSGDFSESDLTFAFIEAATEMYWNDYIHDMEVDGIMPGPDDVIEFITEIKEVVPQRRDNLGRGMIYY